MTRRRTLAVLLGLLVAAIVAEAGLRSAGLDGAAPTKVALIDARENVLRFHCYPTNAGGVLEPLPPLSAADWIAVDLREPPERAPWSEVLARPWCVEYRYGRFGVRGVAGTPRPAPSTLRIVGVGDSFAFGEGVPEHATYFQRLDEGLGEGGSAMPTVEVLNCAQSGADLELDVRTLEWALAEQHATRALLVVTLNDVSTPDAASGNDFINVRSETPPALAWSAVLTLVHRVVTRSAATSATIDAYRAAHDPERNAAGLARAEALLRRAASIEGTSVAVVIYPLLVDLDDYPFEAAHAELTRRAEAVGLPVLDLLPVFRGLDASELHVHPIDHHPNARAHALAASETARWLRDDVPEFLNR